MGNSGGTTGTPISSAVGPVTNSAIALPWTHLSLGRYAKIMGINPAHFFRAHSPNTNPPVFPVTDCSGVWPRFSWQNNDQVSHEELAYAIQSAENDIIGHLGFFPSPTWVEQEPHNIQQFYRREYFSDGLDVREQRSTVIADHNKVIDCGVRALTLIGSALESSGTLEYKDYDNDGVEETAVITLPTTVTSAQQIKVYFSGTNGAPEWEIRPVKSCTIAGGVVTIKIDSWLLIDPEVLSEFPTNQQFRAIDIGDTTYLVKSVDVYREYNDNTQTSAVFVWQMAQETCGPFITNQAITSQQNGFGMVVDGPNGIVMPVPATYSTTELKWITDTWTGTVAPDYVKLYYYSGDYSNEFLRGFTNDPLSSMLADAIAWMATARLTRPFCGCQSASDLASDLAEDLSLSVTGRSHFTPVEIIRNPFGSRKGEVMAWRKLSKLVRGRRAHHALI